MQIKELFQKDIYRTINGVVYADKTDNDIVAQELEEYVLTGELKQYLNRLFEVYSDSLKKADATGHMGVWISGFFGSGKSHFLKILSYLFENRQVKIDGQIKHAVDFFKEKISDIMSIKTIEESIKYPTDVILFNIDSLSLQNDEQAAVLKAFYGVFNRKRGYCFLYPHIAHVESFLVKKGVYEQFKQEFEELTESAWIVNREDYVFYSDDIIKAIRAVLPNQTENKELEEWISNGEKKFPLTIENFSKEVADYVETKGRRLLFMADEMGQFIGMDSNRMLNLQTIVENLGIYAKGKAWVFVTSQEDIDSVLGQKIQNKGNDFSKIQGRFYTRFSLSSSSISEVIQKRILQKSTEAVEVLTDAYNKQKDILLNQLCFGQGTPTMPTYNTLEAYCDSYPFVPYQFNLLQDVFDAIRSVGATGLNLSKGERSMLEAFQTALKSVGELSIGALVPLSFFFPTVQGFLDGSVARSIFNANNIQGIDEFDIELLKTLFLIRYLRNRRIPGTIQNLSVLTLMNTDADMVDHRKSIENSLTKLESENLITRENEEFIFLTIEEQNITREIQNTEIPSKLEIKELSGFIFKDQFDGKTKYKHSNGKFFDIQLSLDEFNSTTKGDISIEFYSPISGQQYELKKENPFLASGGNSNIVVLLPEENAYYKELTLYLKTDRYLSSSAGRELTNGEQNILAQKSRENGERRKKLISDVADLIAQTSVTILGKKFQPKSKNKADFLMELCQDFVNTQFSKLNYLSDPWQDWERMVKSLLSNANTIASDEQNIANPQALEDVVQYIQLSHSIGKTVTLAEFVAKYGKLPYGWPDGNVQVIIAYLLQQGKILIQHNGRYVEGTACIDLFIKPSLYDKVQIEKAIELDHEVLDKAFETVRSLFIDYPPTTTHELAQHIRSNLNTWQQKLKSWKDTISIDPASFPSSAVLQKIFDKILDLLKESLDTNLIDIFSKKSTELIDMGEEYRKLESFHTNQIRIWRESMLLLQKVTPVKYMLIDQDGFTKAYDTIHGVLNEPSPWDIIKNLGPANQTVIQSYENELTRIRERAQGKIDEFREALEPECITLALDPDKKYSVKSRLNQLYDQCKDEKNLSTLHTIFIYEAEKAYNTGLEVLQRIRHSSIKPENVSTPADEKFLEHVKIVELFNFISLETPAEVDAFVEDLRSKLKRYIAQGKIISLEK